MAAAAVTVRVCGWCCKGINKSIINITDICICLREHLSSAAAAVRKIEKTCITHTEGSLVYVLVFANKHSYTSHVWKINLQNGASVYYKGGAGKGATETRQCLLL